MPANNSSSRPSGRSSGRSNSVNSSGRPAGGSRSGSGRPSAGRPSAGRPAGGGSGRPSSSRPSSDRSSTSRPARDGEHRPRRDDARPTRDGDRRTSTGRPARDGERRSDSRTSRDGARTDSRSSGRPARDGERRSDSRTSRDSDRRTSTSRPARDGERRPRRDDARSSDRPRRDASRGPARPRRDDDRRPRRDSDRDDRAPRSRRPDSNAPAIPDHITGDEIHRSIRNELRSLPDGLALRVARHLAACVEVATDDPETAYQHAKAAFDMASRISVVRETAADAAYHAGHFKEALSHYQAVKRMTGKKEYWPIMADCERALGRPQKAIAMASDPIVQGLPMEARVEMRIVVAGARLDQNNPEAALATLQCPELNKPSTESWAARIRYTYADVLTKLGRTAEAIEWFHRAAAVDVDQMTDADERIEELESLGG